MHKISFLRNLIIIIFFWVPVPPIELDYSVVVKQLECMIDTLALINGKTLNMEIRTTRDSNQRWIRIMIMIIEYNSIASDEIARIHTWKMKKKVQEQCSTDLKSRRGRTGYFACLRQQDLHGKVSRSVKCPLLLHCCICQKLCWGIQNAAAAQPRIIFGAKLAKADLPSAEIAAATEARTAAAKATPNPGITLTPAGENAHKGPDQAG